MIRQAPYGLRIKRCFFVYPVNELTKFTEHNRNQPQRLLVFQLAEILYRHVCKTAAAGHCRHNQKKSMQSEIGALKDIHENANRNAANDLIRHDQMVVHRKIKRLERPDTNINNDLQTTSAGKKDCKDCAVRRIKL